MKNINLYILLIAFSFLFFSSCDEKEDWNSKYPGYTHTKVVLPTVTGITDNTANLSFTVDEPGLVYFLILESSEQAPTDSFGFPALDNVAFAEFEEAGESTIPVGGLVDGTQYTVYTVFSNEYGAPGSIGSTIFNTTDNTYPVLTGMLPAPGDVGVSISVGKILLGFSEAVVLKDASKVKVVDAFDESDLGLKGEISVSGNIVTIPLTGNFDYLMDVAVLIDSGAFADLTGNNCPEYYLNAAEDAYELMFSVEDIIDMSVFNGAYHCVANEIGFGNGIKEYDVIVKGGSDVDGFFLQIQNINNWTGSLVYLTVDPVVDTIYFEDQPTGRVYAATGDDIMLTSLDEYAMAGADFKPGNLNRDGSEFKVFGEIYIPDGYFGFYEFTFTKIAQAEAKINRDFTPINEQVFKINR